MYNELLQQYTAFTGQNIPLEDIAALLINAYMIKAQYQPIGSPKEQLDNWKKNEGEYCFSYERNSFLYELKIAKTVFSSHQIILKGSNRTIKAELNIQKYLGRIQLDNLKEDSLKEFDSFMSRTIKNEIEPKLVFQQPSQTLFVSNQRSNQISPPNDLFMLQNNQRNDLFGLGEGNSHSNSDPYYIPPRLDGFLMGPQSFNPQPRMPNAVPRYDPLSPFGSLYDFTPMQDNNHPLPNNDLNLFGNPMKNLNPNQFI